jgi:DNA-directed RNA polymerase specialized sigma subunit
MSSNHVETKRKLKSTEKSEFICLLDRLMLSDTEKQIMELLYIKHKSMVEIANNLGYSEAGIVKAHQRILKKISKII